MKKDLEELFKQVLSLNNVYGTRLDQHMPTETITNLQDLEDYIGACYNNYDASGLDDFITVKY